MTAGSAPARPLRIVVLSQHYPPDNSGNASRVSDLAHVLASEGAQVTVVAPPACYPPGTFPRTWRRRQVVEDGAVRVVRLWTWQPGRPNPSGLSRLAYYLGFAVHAFLWLLVHHRRHDVLVGSTPPMFTAMHGLLLRPLRRRRVNVVEVRDLWIDAAVRLGFAQERSLGVRLSRWVERHSHRSADLVAVTTPHVAETLASRGVPRDRLALVPNGVDASRFRPGLARREPVFVYAGNIGTAQALEPVVEAFALVLPRHPQARLVLAGDGDVRARLVDLAARLGVAHAVQFPGVVARDEVVALLGRARAGLAVLQPVPELDYAVPTKAYEAMACETPFLGSSRGEVRRLAEASGGGRTCAPEAHALAREMEWFLEHPEEAAAMGRRGREHAAALYDRRAIGRAYHARLVEAARRRGIPAVRDGKEPPA